MCLLDLKNKKTWTYGQKRDLGIAGRGIWLTKSRFFCIDIDAGTEEDIQ